MLEEVLGQHDLEPAPHAPRWHDCHDQDTGDEDEAQLRKLLEDHNRWTGSAKAREILDNWAQTRGRFVKVFPTEYKRALAELHAKSTAAAQQVAATV